MITRYQYDVTLSDDTGRFATIGVLVESRQDALWLESLLRDSLETRIDIEPEPYSAIDDLRTIFNDISV